MTALVDGDLGHRRRSSFAAAALDSADDRRSLGAHDPERPLDRDRAAVLVLVGLEAFLRYTRYGLIIRAGVENRSMVTALGIDVRRGVHARLRDRRRRRRARRRARRRSTSAPSTRSTARALLIFAFIVVVIGGLGSVRGTALAAVVVGLVQQFANYYASSGLGDLCVVLLLALVLLVAAAAACSRERSHECRVGSARARSRSRRRRARARAELAIDIPGVFEGELNTPGTLQLLALCLVFGGLALSYDLLFGFTGLLSFGHALYFAVGVYVAGDRDRRAGTGASGRRSR